MIRARAMRQVLSAFLIFVVFACTREPLPNLPDVAAGSFSPAVRQAVESAWRTAKSKPDNAAAAGRLGMVLQAYGQRGAARSAYQRASLLDPKSFDWRYYMGVVSDGPDSVAALRAALRLRDYLPAKLRLGEALLAAGDSAGARQAYSGLEHPAAWFGYGRAASDAAYYEKALAAFPQYGAAMFALAQHYRRAGRAGEAERLMAAYPKFKTAAPPLDDPLMDAVRALNQGPDSLLREAASLEAHGELAQAAQLQLKALELDPQIAQAHVNLVSLYGRLDDSAAGEKHFREAIALNPNAHEAYYNFGVLCYRTGRRREAEAAFLKAIAINPGYAEAHNNLGALLEEQGKLPRATEHFQKAIDLQPDFRLARFHLGRLYANARRYPAAIEQLERTVAVDDEATPTYLYALGATRARAGQTAKAAEALNEARGKATARGQSSLAQAIDRDLAKLKR